LTSAEVSTVSPISWLEQRVSPGLVDRVELAVLQVIDPGCEAEAQQIAEAKHVVRRADSVGVMLGDEEDCLLLLRPRAKRPVRYGDGSFDNA
jgi:hypothetical protein